MVRNGNEVCGVLRAESDGFLRDVVGGHEAVVVLVHGEERVLRVHDLEVDLVELDCETREVLSGHLDTLSFQLARDVLLFLRLALVLVIVCFFSLLFKKLGFAVEFCNLVQQVDEPISPGEDWVGEVHGADLSRLGELRIVVVQVEVCSQVVILYLHIWADFLWFDAVVDSERVVYSVLEDEVRAEVGEVFGGGGRLLEEVLQELVVGGFEVSVEDVVFVLSDIVYSGVDQRVVLLEGELVNGDDLAADVKSLFACLEVYGGVFVDAVQVLHEGFEVSVFDRKAPHGRVVDELLPEELEDFLVELRVVQQPVDVVELEDVCVMDVLFVHEVEDVRLASQREDIAYGLHLGGFPHPDDLERLHPGGGGHEAAVLVDGGGVAGELSFAGEVEEELDDLGGERLDVHVGALHVLEADHGDGALRDLCDHVDFVLRLRGVGDGHPRHVQFAHHELLHVLEHLAGAVRGVHVSVERVVELLADQDVQVQLLVSLLLDLLAEHDAVAPSH